MTTLGLRMRGIHVGYERYAIAANTLQICYD